jgi:hypothetical protein
LREYRRQRPDLSFRIISSHEARSTVGHGKSHVARRAVYNLDMGFQVDTESEPGVLRFRLEGTLSVEEARAFVDEHNRGVDHFAGRGYVVFGDMRAARPLSQECAEIIERAKRHSAAQRGFLGSAILVASNVVALQHRRTSIRGGVMPTELISENETECRQHLEKLRRGRP